MRKKRARKIILTILNLKKKIIAEVVNDANNIIRGVASKEVRLLYRALRHIGNIFFYSFFFLFSFIIIIFKTNTTQF
jgi:hypothetical protein